MTPAVLAMLLAAIPEVPGLVVAIAGIFKKYPALTPEMIVAAAVELRNQGDPAVDSMQAQIDAYRLAHPVTP